MQALTWPLKEVDVDRTLDKLAKFQDLLTVALDVTQTYVHVTPIAVILIFLADI
jgi:hypothetical protein